MKFEIVTIFPELFPGTLASGIVGRALTKGLFSLNTHDLRDFAEGPHRQVDDLQYGGNAGMVLKPEPIARAYRQIKQQAPDSRTILLSPQGRRFDQEIARDLAAESHVVLFCGRYQGVDERARQLIGEELSLGDFVLSGGEVAAMAIIEATVRLIPDVVGDAASLETETFSPQNVYGWEAPLYTRPAVFEGQEVPAVLREGNHAAIESWRQQKSLERKGAQ